jgi:DNA replication protein DnaC
VSRPAAGKVAQRWSTQWGHVVGDEMIAAAVLDRLLHHSHTLLIQGDSYRLKQKKRAGFLGSSKP